MTPLGILGFCGERGPPCWDNAPRCCVTESLQKGPILRLRLVVWLLAIPAALFLLSEPIAIERLPGPSQRECAKVVDFWGCTPSR